MRKKAAIFGRKNVRCFCSVKNITASTVRLDESSTNNFVELMMF